MSNNTTLVAVFNPPNGSTILSPTDGTATAQIVAPIQSGNAYLAFNGLSDVSPKSYSGIAGYIPTVNDDENGIQLKSVANALAITSSNYTALGNLTGVNTGDETATSIETKLGVTESNVIALSNLSGINTGDETATTIETKLGVSASNITALSNLSGTNTGDETKASIESKLGVSDSNIASLVLLSGTNTGDETAATIESKLAVTSSNVASLALLSGTNTGDEALASDSGLTLTSHVLAMGTPTTITASTTNSVSTSTHTHALTISKSDIGLGNVENTALSTWAGTTNITTLGTIATGIWNGTIIASDYIASALTGKTYNGLTLTANATGFSIAGGTTSKTMTIAGTTSIGGDFTTTGTASVSGANTGDETTATIKTKLGAASTSADGYLTSSDFTTFNNKSPITTGLISGGRISVASTTTFNVAAGSGIIVDWTTGSPVTTNVSWSAFSGITASYIASAQTSYVFIDYTGALYQTITTPTFADVRTKIYIGRLIHVAMTTLESVVSNPVWVSDLGGLVYDMARSLGNIVTGPSGEGDGLIPYAPSASLNIALTSGMTFRREGNYGTSYVTPNTISSSAINPATFVNTYYNGTAWITSSGTTSLDTTYYNNVASGLVAMDTGKFQIKRVYHFPGSETVGVLYGQKQYASMDAAVTGLTTDAVSVPPLALGASLRGAIIFRKGETDLTNTTYVKFVAANKFCAFGGGGSGGSSSSGVSSITATTPIAASSSTGDITITHATSGVTAGTYNSSTQLTQFTVNTSGHITATPTTITLAASATTDATNASNISSGTLASARGGAGAISGIMKADGSGVVSAAISGTDYASPLETNNAQTGTTYTLVLSDASKLVTMNNSASNVLTIPLNSSVAFSTGAWLDVQMIGSGVTTITGATGVTVNGTSAGSVSLNSMQRARLIQTATDTWLVGLPGASGYGNETASSNLVTTDDGKATIASVTGHSAVTSGGVAKWTLENVLTDSFGSYTLTNSGLTFSTDSAFPLGSRYVAVDDGSGFATFTATSGMPSGSSDRTLCAWIKTSATAERYIAGYGTNATGQECGLGVSSAGKIILEGNGSGYGGTSTGSSVNDGTWKHVAATLSGSGLIVKFYVNGVLDSTVTGSNAFNTVLSYGNIGTIRSSSSLAFNGSLSDVRVYSRALTATEIADIYAGEGGSVKKYTLSETSLTRVLDNGVCDGRLTLSTGTPILSASVSGAATVFFTPFRGNRVALYDATLSKWIGYAFSELSLAGTNFSAASTLYDLFLSNTASGSTRFDSPSLALSAVAWSSSTAGSSSRATALTLKDGVYVLSTDYGKRYLGTILTNSTGGQIDCVFSSSSRAPVLGVWNCYNQTPAALYRFESTEQWTYATVAYRQANGSTANQIDLAIGLPGRVSSTLCNQIAPSTTAAGSSVGICLDASSGPSTGGNVAGVYYTTLSLGVVNNYKNTALSAGRHYLAAVEYSNGTSVTFYGVSQYFYLFAETNY